MFSTLLKSPFRYLILLLVILLGLMSVALYISKMENDIVQKDLKIQKDTNDRLTKENKDQKERIVFLTQLNELNQKDALELQEKQNEKIKDLQTRTKRLQGALNANRKWADTALPPDVASVLNYRASDSASSPDKRQ